VSRQSNQTLPNVMLEKGLFDDLKIVDLMDKYGPTGFTIYASLLMKINNDRGYYTQMTPSLAISIQRDIGSKWISREKVIEVINFLAQCDLISSSLLEKGVLTSVGIQRRYLDTKKKSRAVGYSTEEHWLLDKSPDDNPLPHTNSNSCNSNSDKCNNNADKCNSNSLYKEKNKMNIRGSRYGLHSLVELTQDEYDRLYREIGESALKDYVNRLDSWLTKKPVSGSHANVILKWYTQDRPRNEATVKDEESSRLNALFADITEENI